MDKLAIQEKHKYDLIWKTFSEYRENSPGESLTPIFFSYLDEQIKPGDTLIDFGCGPGRSALTALQSQMKVHLVDISENCLDPEIFLLCVKKRIQFTQSCLWDLSSEIKSARWITCFDVLEHIPETQVDACLKGMADRMNEGGMFSIHLAEEQFGRVVGQKLHLTIKSAVWWKEKMERYFKIDNVFPTDAITLVVTLRKR